MVESYHNPSRYTWKQSHARAKAIAVEKYGPTEWRQGGHPLNCTDSHIPLDDIQHLYKLLDEYGPIYARYQGGGEAHLVVVTGVDVHNNVVYTNNPWGIKGTQTYDDFCNGHTKFFWQKKNGMKLDFLCIPARPQGE